MAKLQNEKVILENVYPMIAASLDKNKTKYIRVISKFMEARTESLYDIAPCDRIPFNKADGDLFFDNMNIDSKEVLGYIQKTYYYDLPMYSQNESLKDPFSISILSAIRYFFMKNMKKETEMSLLYLAFSGKFYPSIHYKSYKKVTPAQYRHVMEYVVNNMMSNKYDIVREGSVIGAIRSICNTWITSYAKMLKSFRDEDVIYIVHQLSSRISSFMKNIASLYYEAYSNRDMYMTYDNDSLADSDFHLADSDSLRAERIVQNTLNKLQTSTVDYSLCRMASDNDVKTDEVKTIIESVLSHNENIPDITELIKLLVSIYFNNSKSKEVTGHEFIVFSITPKPNSKDKYYIRQRELIETLLQKNSLSYRKRSSRPGTKNSYNNVLLKYFVFCINKANK